jgi:hypothetical protein
MIRGIGFRGRHKAGITMDYIDKLEKKLKQPQKGSREMFGNSKVYTCSKHNYSGVNEPCPDCNVESLNQKIEQESQPLPWQTEKPTKPCVVVCKYNEGDSTNFDLYIIKTVDDMDFLERIFADEYLILEEL